MSGIVANNAPTILDYLDQDCWRAVLEYVPLRDVVRTERVSRRWQDVVLKYLGGIHFKIGLPYITYCKPPPNVHLLLLRMDECASPSFKNWILKYGPSVIDTYCSSLEYMNILRNNCPNLQVLEFFSLPVFPRDNYSEHFKDLRRLSFTLCPVRMDDDDFVGQFITRDGLEELEITDCNIVTGECLKNIKSKKLKSLVIENCLLLDISWVLESDCLGELTRFRHCNISNFSNGGSRLIHDDIHLLLEKMPKLEQLDVRGIIRDNDAFFRSVCGLTQLKILILAGNMLDSELEAVTRCCQELHTLELANSHFGEVEGVTGAGIEVMCRNAGFRLLVITCLGYPLSDDDVLTCVRRCPALQLLTVESPMITRPRALLERLAGARRELRLRRPLRVWLKVTDVDTTPTTPTMSLHLRTYSLAIT